jgi:hypothetical protein
MGPSRALKMGVLVLLAVNTVSFAAKAVSIEKLRIRNQIVGWVEENKSYKSFNPEKLFEIINGGAPEYIDNGMQKGFYQRLRNLDSAAIELFAEDFGSDENARKMLAAKRSNFSNGQSAENVDTASIIIHEVVGGFWVCGIVGSYYFELTLMGIKDREKAQKEINKYFDNFRKTSENKKKRGS